MAMLGSRSTRSLVPSRRAGGINDRCAQEPCGAPRPWSAAGRRRTAPRNSRPTAPTPSRCASPRGHADRAPRPRRPWWRTPHHPRLEARGPALPGAARPSPAPARAPLCLAQERPAVAQQKRAGLALAPALTQRRRPLASPSQGLRWTGARAPLEAAGRWPPWHASWPSALRSAPRPLRQFRPAQPRQPVRAQAWAWVPPTAWPMAAPAMASAGRAGAPASATAPPARRHAASVTQPPPRPGAGVPEQRTPVYCCGEPLARPAGGAAPSSGIQVSRSPG